MIVGFGNSLTLTHLINARRVELLLIKVWSYAFAIYNSQMHLQNCNNWQDR